MQMMYIACYVSTSFTGKAILMCMYVCRIRNCYRVYADVSPAAPCTGQGRFPPKHSTFERLATHLDLFLFSKVLNEFGRI